MAMQPVGPLPASTYWRRRGLLLVLFLILVLLLAKACGGQPKKDSLSASGPSPRPSGSVQSAPSPSAPSPSALSPSALSPSALSASHSPQPTSPASPQTCPDAVLQVSAVSDAEAYPSGSAPRFTLTVRNSGSAPCRRALGPDAVELRVFSGEDRIWSSSDCSAAKGEGVLTLKPGEAQALTVRWPGKRTKPHCAVGEVAQPGTYRVTARVGTIVRQGSVFRITA